MAVPSLKTTSPRKATVSRNLFDCLLFKHIAELLRMLPKITQKLAFDGMGVSENRGSYCRLGFTEKIRRILDTSSEQAPGCFPLLLNPNKEEKAAIIGMFVLRPGQKSWDAPLLNSSHTLHEGIYDVSDWVFNYAGLDGGWLISDGNILDAFRLAFQYGISDAVIISSRTVAVEGVDSPQRQGYLWQPYGPAEWPHLKAACPELTDLIYEQRLLWQEQGHISSKRKYPAQIVFSLTGDFQEGGHDFLEARIFSARHPDGSQIEVYILTSQLGAEHIRNRVDRSFPQLKHRIDDILIVLPPKKESPPDCSSEVDIKAAAAATATATATATVDIGIVPAMLYKRLDMRLVNHDGGRKLIREFCLAGAVCQLNLTLCRKKSIREVLRAHRKRTATITTVAGAFGDAGASTSATSAAAIGQTAVTTAATTAATVTISAITTSAVTMTTTSAAVTGQTADASHAATSSYTVSPLSLSLSDPAAVTVTSTSTQPTIIVSSKGANNDDRNCITGYDHHDRDDNNDVCRKDDEEFDRKVQYFFSPSSTTASDDQKVHLSATTLVRTDAAQTVHSIPRHLRPVYVLTDLDEDVAVVTIDTRGHTDL